MAINVIGDTSVCKGYVVKFIVSLASIIYYFPRTKSTVDPHFSTSHSHFSKVMGNLNCQCSQKMIKTRSKVTTLITQHIPPAMSNP